MKLSKNRKINTSNNDYSKTVKKVRVICTLTCLDNIKCESTSTLRSWAAGIGDVIQPIISISMNTRKSSALKARASVIFFCLVRLACQTVCVFYFPGTEVATCSPRLPIFQKGRRSIELPEIVVLERLSLLFTYFLSRFRFIAVF